MACRNDLLSILDFCFCLIINIVTNVSLLMDLNIYGALPERNLWRETRKTKNTYPADDDEEMPSFFCKRDKAAFTHIPFTLK